MPRAVVRFPPASALFDGAVDVADDGAVVGDGEDTIVSGDMEYAVVRIRDRHVHRPFYSTGNLIRYPGCQHLRRR